MRMSVALSALSLVAVGCRIVSPDPALEYPCASDADCAALSRSCVDGTCRAPDEDAGPEAPDACVPTQSCASQGLRCGTADDGCGNALDCGGCPQGEGCGAAGDAGVCETCGTADFPDERFIDSDCDGIDGQRDAGIFVDGTLGADTNPGTLEAPVRSVRRAVELAEARAVPILISEGVYDGGLEVAGVPAQLFGAYSRDAGWSRAARFRTVILSPASGARVRDVDGGVRFDHLELLSSSATAVSQPASVGLRVSGVKALLLSFVRVHAGRGLDGAAGASGMEGAAGENGKTPGGATSQAGGAGGLGCGGRGGAGGGAGSGTNRGDPGVEGGTGAGTSGGGLGGNGGAGGTCDPLAPGSPGDTGLPGAPGDVGNPGTPGGSVGSWMGEVYVVATGEVGQTGTPGQGGGGGGGGGGGETPVGLSLCSSSFGGGGGGGGAGGCAGSGGFGGFGGGASVALWVRGSQVEFGPGVILETEGGGAGGEGGMGGAGGDAGVGAPGTTTTGRGGSGGPGAPGGPGGAGGPGGGGGGGPSVGAWCLDGGSLAGSSASFEIGPGGTSGAGPGLAGAAGLAVGELGCP